MGWRPKQIRSAAIAAREAGLGKAQRYALLETIPNNRAIDGNHASSKSPRLTNHDFEWFMAQCEMRVYGKLSNWPWGYWSGKVKLGDLERARFCALRIANTLQLTYRDDGTPYLKPDGDGLRGWIYKMTNGRTNDLNELSMREVGGLIDGLTNYGPPGLRKHIAKEA